jgi:hypothetical protein
MLNDEAVRLVPRPDLRHDVMTRILEEFHRFPCLALTLAQACRLWRLEDTTCQTLFDLMVDNGALRRRQDGRYALS